MTKKKRSRNYKMNSMKRETVNPQDAEEVATETEGKEDIAEAVQAEAAEKDADSIEHTEEADLSEEIETLKEQVEKDKKEYMFLMAEFDNFRKRTLREKAELIRNAGEQVWKGLLPIVDDMERGIKAASSTDNAASVLEGLNLIYNKLKKYMEQNGVKEFDPDDHDFDTEKHEAISAIAAPDESQKGKILDTVEKGYMLNDKVLRHAKVVVAQ